LDILLQTLATGVVLAGFYSLFAIGLSLGWGLLHTISFMHFSVVLLTAYITYELATTFGWNPLYAVFVNVPLAVVLSVLLQLFVTYFRIDVFGTLIVTFGLFLAFEAAIALRWSVDFRTIPFAQNPLYVQPITIGPVRLPVVFVIASVLAIIICGGTWWLLTRSTPGRAIRAFVEDSEIAESFGVNYRRLALLIAALSGATGGITGTLFGINYTLTPVGIELWIAVIFAVVLLGGLANPLGVMGAAVIIGVVESFVRQYGDPSWARLAALAILALALVFRPEGLFKRLVEEARG
jgi:branched-chain amino acid transport system permease protein